VPVFDPNKPTPTLATWIRDMSEDKADLRPSELRNARPPTVEERAKLKEMRKAGTIE